MDALYMGIVVGTCMSLRSHLDMLPREKPACFAHVLFLLLLLGGMKTILVATIAFGLASSLGTVIEGALDRGGRVAGSLVRAEAVAGAWEQLCSAGHGALVSLWWGGGSGGH